MVRSETDVGGVGRLWTLNDKDIQVDSDDEGDDSDGETRQMPLDARRLEKLKSVLVGAADVEDAEVGRLGASQSLVRQRRRLERPRRPVRA